MQTHSSFRMIPCILFLMNSIVHGRTVVSISPWLSLGLNESEEIISPMTTSTMPIVIISRMQSSAWISMSSRASLKSISSLQSSDSSSSLGSATMTRYLIKPSSNADAQQVGQLSNLVQSLPELMTSKDEHGNALFWAASLTKHDLTNLQSRALV